MKEHAAEPLAPHAVPHGGDIDAVRRRFPEARPPWLDLSTGINPVPYPVPELAPTLWSRLPLASEERALQEAAARCYGAPRPAMVAAAPGTQALIQLLPSLVSEPTLRVAVVGPTYAEHARTWQRAGHAIRDAATLAEASHADVVVVVNPDNPTGRLCARDELVEVARGLARRGGLLVVDEAFIDVVETPGASVIPDLPPSTIVLRSFGKAYGLAGLRLGFAIAAEPMADRLRDLLGPWAVAGPALEIGRTALSDPGWLAGTVRRLAHDAARLDAVLMAAGCTIMGGTPLFRLAQHPDAAALADRLGGHAIHVRSFPHQPTWLRFGLPGGEADWGRLQRALAVA